MDDALTIAKIIKEAGGASAIQRANLSIGVHLTRDAVYKWTRTGIPDRHWSVLMALTPYGPSEIYAANCHTREQHHHREAAE